MNKEEFIALIESMEENCQGYGEDWFNEDEIIKFLEENKSDKEIFQISITFHPGILAFADENITDDIEFMTIAVEEWGINALKYSSERIKDNREIVNEAINYSSNYGSGCVLEYVSDNLRNDIEIVEFAMNCCLDPDTFEELQYASYEIRSNRNFIINQLDIFTEKFENPAFLKYISDELKQDAEFVKKLVEINPNSEKYLK